VELQGGVRAPEKAAAANNPRLLAIANSDALGEGSELESKPLGNSWTFVSPFNAKNPKFWVMPEKVSISKEQQWNWELFNKPR
jgi:hypothetical protein